MKAHALDLAAKGWAVFPCKWAGDDAKAPLTAHGHHDATTDADVIRSWWSRWPLAMIGAPVPDRLVVLDVDPRNGGDVAALGDLPETLRAWSGRGDGGVHFYFLRPATEMTSTRLPVGIDLKANGYCIVPPSLHPATGDPYRWDLQPVAPLPPSLLETLRRRPTMPRPTRRDTGSTKGLTGFIERQHEGGKNRNDALYWACCRALESGVDNLNDLRDAALSTGLGEREVNRTIESARIKATLKVVS